jgi:hypothetical protein
MRPSRKAAFTRDEQKIQQERDKLDDVLATLPSRNGEPTRLQSVPTLPDTEPSDSAAAQQVLGTATETGPAAATVGERSPEVATLIPATTVSTPPVRSAPATVPQTSPETTTAPSGGDRDRRAGKATGSAKHAEENPKKPPAAWISAAVYRHLVDYSDQEKRMKRAAARPFGVIAMDAIEKHAEALASAWKGSGTGTPQPGKLFVREQNSRYRRHDLPPRSITLQGIGPENGRLLKRLKKQWGAGSVSDLVEKALRFEFGMSGEQG